MSVNYVTGDLFDSQWEFDALAHGVNCRGFMGSGIAPLFKERWCLMYETYRELCQRDILQLGQVYAYKTPKIRPSTDPAWIYNIASQYEGGANAKYGALVTGLYFVRYHAETHGLNIVGLPRIGAGIGGLDWQRVKVYAESVLAASPVLFTFVSLED